MGNRASKQKVKGDSPRSSSHPWSSAPCGSWVIRFSPGHPTSRLNKTKDEIKGLPLYHWSSPDWITDEIFNKLMFVVVQMFLEGNLNRFIRLIEEPLEAAEMITQFNTFIDSTNQDIMELQNQLFESAHENIHLHVEDEQLCCLDLLVTNEFDPRYEVRAVISRKSRNSKSSLLHSVSSTIKSKMGSFKKKRERQASHKNPVQPPFPVPSCDSTVFNTQLRPTAPLLSELNERTETVTSDNDVDNADKVCITAVLYNSNMKNGTKDGDRERLKTENSNVKSTRNLEEGNAELEWEMPSSSLLLPSTSETFKCTSTFTCTCTSEQSLGNEVIAKQKDVCFSKVIQEKSTDVYSSLTGVIDSAVLLQTKQNSEEEEIADESRCEQENSGEDAKPSDYRKDDDPGYDNVPSGSKEAEPGEHRNDDDPVYDYVPSGTKQHKPSEHREDDGPVCVDSSPRPRHADPTEDKEYNGYKPSSSSLVYPPFYGLSRGCFSHPLQGESNGFSRKRKADVGEGDRVELVAKRLQQDDRFSEAEGNRGPSGPEHVESSKQKRDNSPTVSDVPPGAKQAESGKNQQDSGPICADSSSGIVHTESKEDKDNDISLILNDCSPGAKLADSTQPYKNDDPVSVMNPPGKSSPSTFLPIYGLSKSCFRSTTQQPVSTEAQESCANVKKEKEEASAKPQIHEPSSRSLVYLPFHGLSRGCFSPPKQGESTGVLSRKRKDDIDESKGDKFISKRLKQENASSETEENRNPCHSSKGADHQSDTEIKPKCHIVDDNQSDGGNDSSSSESVEWHDALEDAEP